LHILRSVGGRQTDWFIDSCKKRRLVFLINSMAAFSFAGGFLFCRWRSLLPVAFSFAGGFLFCRKHLSFPPAAHRKYIAAAIRYTAE